MKRLFISQPMKGLTDEEILKTREKAIKSAEKKLGEPVESLIRFSKTHQLTQNRCGIWQSPWSCWLRLMWHISLQAGRTPGVQD